MDDSKYRNFFDPSTVAEDYVRVLDTLDAVIKYMRDTIDNHYTHETGEAINSYINSIKKTDEALAARTNRLIFNYFVCSLNDATFLINSIYKGLLDVLTEYDENRIEDWIKVRKSLTERVNDDIKDFLETSLPDIDKRDNKGE